MFFAPKAKGYFVEQNDHATLLARTAPLDGSLVVEEVAECAAGDEAALSDAIRRMQPKKSPSGYLNATCGVFPPRRLLRKASLELKRLKEPAYFAEVLTTQFRIEPEKYTVHILNATDGHDLDIAKSPQKEALFCGLPGDDIVAAQDALLNSGIYPERLELGSVAMLGGLVDYLGFKKSKTPTLVLEIGAETTHSFIVTSAGVEASRPIPQGLDSMVPLVQKELGLRDVESARKLFFSNTFDFTGMGPLLVKKLLKELQSSIGFYEVQTGQSVGQVLCTSTPPKLAWLDGVIAAALGVSAMTLEIGPWLLSRKISVADGVVPGGLDAHWFGLFSLMVSQTVSAPDAVAAEKKN